MWALPLTGRLLSQPEVEWWHLLWAPLWLLVLVMLSVPLSRSSS